MNKPRTWLIMRRKEQDLTQQQLADKIGISVQHVSEIERGNKNPSGKVALKWALALGFDMHYFFADEVYSEKKNAI